MARPRPPKPPYYKITMRLDLTDAQTMAAIVSALEGGLGSWKNVKGVKVMNITQIAFRRGIEKVVAR